MWGTHSGRIAMNSRHRFIPTHVGNSSAARARRAIRSVHPHACGELPVSPAPKRQGIGSSPRMWGTRGAKFGSDEPRRFIPTHVGNSRRLQPSVTADSVHPHACGELIEKMVTILTRIGSSPRMWGTLPPPEPVPPGPRFIPTHVGNSTAPGAGPTRTAVHPHACGEL